MGWLYDIFGTSQKMQSKLAGTDHVHEYWESDSNDVAFSHSIKLPPGELTIVMPNGEETHFISNGEEYDEEEIFYETLNSDINRLKKFQ